MSSRKRKEASPASVQKADADNMKKKVVKTAEPISSIVIPHKLAAKTSDPEASILRRISYVARTDPDVRQLMRLKVTGSLHKAYIGALRHLFYETWACDENDAEFRTVEDCLRFYTDANESTEFAPASDMMCDAIRESIRSINIWDSVYSSDTANASDATGSAKADVEKSSLPAESMKACKETSAAAEKKAAATKADSDFEPPCGKQEHTASKTKTSNERRRKSGSRRCTRRPTVCETHCGMGSRICSCSPDPPRRQHRRNVCDVHKDMGSRDCSCSPERS